MDPADRLSTAFLRNHPEQAARVLERFPAREVAALLERAEPSLVAAVLAAAIPVLSSGYLVHLGPAHAGASLQHLPTDTVLTLLRPLDRDPREAVLATFPIDRRKAFDRLLLYPEGTAGSLMNPFVFVLSEELTVSEALGLVREAGQERFYFPYVVDQKQKLVGLLTVRGLMLADPGQQLAEIMHRDVVRLPAGATVASLERIPGWRAYQSLPVVDENGVLIGAVPNDRLTRLESASLPTDGNAGVAGIFLALGATYWTCLGQLAMQATDLFARLTRPHVTD